MHQLPAIEDENLISGLDTWSDAGVYRLSDELALVQTVDFFPPVVNDPYAFGQIAAANALSDVYAMGGHPLTAMNVVGFPVEQEEGEVLRLILLGGLSKLDEAGVTLVGGHTLNDTELKYGMVITGTVHPEKLVTNEGARPGDRLVLTKPLGSGIITTALKGGTASPKIVRTVTETMAALNDKASAAMIQVGVNACTDVTGYGLLGHLHQMALVSRVRAKIRADAVPILPGVLKLAAAGIIPGGSFANKRYASQFTTAVGKVSEDLLDVLYDAQTSGGLLISVAEEKADDLLGLLREKAVTAALIGEIIEGEAGTIEVS